MENTKSLKNGTGTAYLAIFDNNKKPVCDNRGIPIGVYMSDFWYQYEEDGSDSAEITLNTDDPDIVDIPALAHDNTLRVQWGLIFSDGTSESSPVRKIVIRDHDIDFDENGVKLLLKCTDGADKIKALPADRKPQLLAEWIKNNLAGYGVTMVSNKVNEVVSFNKKENGNNNQQSK